MQVWPQCGAETPGPAGRQQPGDSGRLAGAGGPLPGSFTVAQRAANHGWTIGGVAVAFEARAGCTTGTRSSAWVYGSRT